FSAGSTPTGSYAAYYVADALLKYRPKADIAIQNAGGVRTQFLQRPFTVADAHTMPPFSNTFATVDIRGHRLRAAMEVAPQSALGKDGYEAFAKAIEANPGVHEDSHVAYAVPLVEYFQKHLAGNLLPVLDPADYSLKSVVD